MTKETKTCPHSTQYRGKNTMRNKIMDYWYVDQFEEVRNRKYPNDFNMICAFCHGESGGEGKCCCDECRWCCRCESHYSQCKCNREDGDEYDISQRCYLVLKPRIKGGRVDCTCWDTPEKLDRKIYKEKKSY